MKKKSLFNQMIFLSLILIFLLPLQSFSQDFPNKPITMYIGYAAGGMADLTGRGLATEAERILGVPVVVENKAGGSSAVGCSLLATKKPDGYTIAAIGSTALHTVPIMTDLNYDPLKDFTYIIAYTKNPLSLCVRSDSPFKTLPELIKYARDNPGKLSYSSTGVGSNSHLIVEHVAKEANVKFKHVPFKGGIESYTALLGGHVDFVGGAGSDRNYAKAGQFRMLVIFRETRDPIFPDVPTWIELGYKAPPEIGYYMLVAPKNLPDPVYKKLESAFTQAANSPKFQEVLEKWDSPFTFRNRRQLEKEIPENYNRFSEFLKECGLAKKK
jgi:tripartite-type tricarboxylate transporter receptor subunit TctC